MEAHIRYNDRYKGFDLTVKEGKNIRVIGFVAGDGDDSTFTKLMAMATERGVTSLVYRGRQVNFGGPNGK